MMISAKRRRRKGKIARKGSWASERFRMRILWKLIWVKKLKLVPSKNIIICSKWIRVSCLKNLKNIRWLKKIKKNAKKCKHWRLRQTLWTRMIMWIHCHLTWTWKDPLIRMKCRRLNRTIKMKLCTKKRPSKKIRRRSTKRAKKNAKRKRRRGKREKGKNGKRKNKNMAKRKRNQKRRWMMEMICWNLPLSKKMKMKMAMICWDLWTIQVQMSKQQQQVMANRVMILSMICWIYRMEMV